MAEQEGSSERANSSPGKSRSSGKAHPQQPAATVIIDDSAGGLEACSRLIGALPSTTGMAFVLMQRLDSASQSLLAELLATLTAITVIPAGDGIPIAAEHIYVIPPGVDLAIISGRARPLTPKPCHLPRPRPDVRLRNESEENGSQMVFALRSTTGADGSDDAQHLAIEFDQLLASIQHAAQRRPAIESARQTQEASADRFRSLTKRQHEVLDRVLDGQLNKNIAADLGISQRTVENHRASIMHRTGVKSLPELVRLAVAAEPIEVDNTADR